MKKLTEQEILENWTKFLNLIEKNFSGERKKALLEITKHFQDRMIFAPASSKEHYHSAHPGGYIEHILNVYNIAMDLFKIWQKYSNSIDYSTEEIALVALFHDLGKIGDLTEEFYFPQDNEWRKQNMGEIYKINDKVVNMNDADRSLYLLQHFGVKLTQNEWIAIKIHEGMYEESNSKYLKVMSENSIIKSHLPHLIHHADLIASRIEYEQWKNNYSKDNFNLTQKSTSKKYTVKKTLADMASEKNKDILTNFFNNNIVKDDDLNIDSLFEDNKKE